MEVFYRWVASHHDGVYRSLYLSILVLIVALAKHGDRDTAQQELNYVLQHGNKLAVIGLARALLAQKECGCVPEHFLRT